MQTSIPYETKEIDFDLFKAIARLDTAHAWRRMKSEGASSKVIAKTIVDAIIHENWVAIYEVFCMHGKSYFVKGELFNEPFIVFEYAGVIYADHEGDETRLMDFGEDMTYDAPTMKKIKARITEFVEAIGVLRDQKYKAKFTDPSAPF